MANLKFIQRQSRYSSDIVLQRRVVDQIVRSSIGHVFLQGWQALTAADYVNDASVFGSLQLLVSIVWNCTDKSISLCDSLARASVVSHLLTQLTECRLADAVDSNSVYFVKAYLGILHNMVQLCADSRHIFRSAGAVKTLRCFLDRPQGLVRTKAYLILAYVVDEQEN